MTDIDTLLDRLRAAAADHATSQVPEQVAVRHWPPTAPSGARQAVLDTWATSRSSSTGPFLALDAADFIELAFLRCVGRAADPVGRSHYVGRMQQGMPRLEVLAHLAGSPESVKYRGRTHWPFWLRPLLWGLRLPSAFARRVTRALLRRIERRLAQRAGAEVPGLAWRLAGAVDEQDRLRQSNIDTLSADLLVTSGRLTATESELANAKASTQALADGLASWRTRVETSLETTAQALTAVRARIAVREYHSADGSQPSVAHDGRAPVADDEVSRYYLTLESVFRGDPDRIRAQLEADYLPLLVDARDAAGDGRCVDLGCGRGEWLDVLAAHGFSALGVDLNPAMAGAARARGHEVTIGDALAFLRAMPDASTLAVSALHLAEHLDFSTLFRVVAESRRVLKPRGLLILETPNPENIWVATHTFHHDPTHSQPLTPTSLEFLVNHHGLETVAVLRLHPYPDEARLPGNDPASERLNAMTCGGQDFAIVARKTPVE